MSRARATLSTRIRLLGAALAPFVLVAAGQAAETIQLANGDVLSVDIVDVGTDHVTFTHAVFGTVTVPRSSVTFLTPPAADAARAAQMDVADAAAAAAASEATTGAPAEGTAAAPAGGAAPPAPPIGPVIPPKEWKFRFTLAGSGSAGNTEDISFTTRLTALREVPTARTAAEATYFFGSSRGDKSDNKFNAAIRHDFLFPEKRYFFFVDGRFDYDEFNSWLYRLTGHGGIGYKLILPPPLALNVLAGIGAIKEWKSMNEDVRAEGQFGFEGKWDISELQSIVFSTMYYPDFSTMPEFRWVNSAGWNCKLAADSPLALTAGIQHEYQSQVDPGQDKNDYRFFAGVDWEF